jgi:hypothetical protein
MAIEEGESSSKVTIPKTEELIKKAKDDNGDIEITINNNITIKRLIKVVPPPPPKFSRDPDKLEEYLNKTQIYIDYATNRFEKEH